MCIESKPESVELFDIPVSNVTLKDLVHIIRSHVVGGVKLRIGVVNAAKIVKMRKDKLLMDSVTTSDIVIADGASVVLASRLLGKRLAERVTGIDLMNGLLESASENGHRVYLLGATEEISKRLEEELKRRYPKLIIAGRRNGYFGEDEEPSVVQEINASRPDYLFVGISSPKKEIFMARWESGLSATVIHGVGGSFDVIAGYVRRAPAAFQKLGLEWLYRLVQEPRRLAWRYVSTNTMFLFLLVQESLKEIGSRFK